MPEVKGPSGDNGSKGNLGTSPREEGPAWSYFLLQTNRECTNYQGSPKLVLEPSLPNPTFTTNVKEPVIYSPTIPETPKPLRTSPDPWNVNERL